MLVQRPRCACAGRAACAAGRGGPPSSAARGSSSATASRSERPSPPSTSSTTSPEDPPRRPPKTVPKFLAIKRVPDRYIFLCRCDNRGGVPTCGVTVRRVSAEYVCSAASTTTARSAGCSFLDTSASKTRSRRCRSTHFGLVVL